VSRRAAYITLGFLGMIFVLGVDEALGHAFDYLIPDELARLAVAILSGVAIGAILAALRANGRDSGAGE
jgi:hypothetical protein